MENELEIDVGKRFDKLEQLIDNLAQFCAKQFNRVDERFAAVNARFDKVGAHLERVESKVDGITRRIDQEVDERAQLSDRVSKLEEASRA